MQFGSLVLQLRALKVGERYTLDDGHVITAFNSNGRRAWAVLRPGRKSVNRDDVRMSASEAAMLTRSDS